MASNIFECDVCSEDYNSEERKPLSLPCGHTFCQRCLSRVLATAFASCPKCRKSAIGVQLVNLPVIYALIPNTKNIVQETRHSPSADQCKSHHGYNLDYFCTVCGDIVCRKCSKQFHAQHRVEFIEDIVDRDELSTKFVSELQGEMKASVERVTTCLLLANSISNSLNEMRAWEEVIPLHKVLFQSRITATTQDLQTWQNAAPKSIEEKRELFKKLCQHWRDKEKVFLDKQDRPNLSKNLDELIAAAKKIEKRAGYLKRRLQERDGCNQQGIVVANFPPPFYPGGSQAGQRTATTMATELEQAQSVRKRPLEFADATERKKMKRSCPTAYMVSASDNGSRALPSNSMAKWPSLKGISPFYTSGVERR